MDDKIFYIGSFPPPYGGATIKNKNLNDDLKKYLTVRTFNTSRLKSKYEYLRLLSFLTRHRKKNGVICIFDLSLFKITKFLNVFFRNSIESITVFITGGNFQDRLVEHNEDINIYKKFKNIVVESNLMQQRLEEMGFSNVLTIPNLRRISHQREYYEPHNKKFEILYMSQVTKDKGIFNLLKASEVLACDNENFSIDIYGPVKKDIKDKFEALVSKNSNVNYKGVFISNEKNNIYDLIKKYDVLVFPTQYKGEGFPGILAEAKIAGIPIIATDFKYNSDIVDHLVDGILVATEDIEKNLTDAIKLLMKNKELTNRMRQNSFESGKNYIQDNYIEQIINMITS